MANLIHFFEDRNSISLETRDASNHYFYDNFLHIAHGEVDAHSFQPFLIGGVVVSLLIDLALVAVFASCRPKCPTHALLTISATVSSVHLLMYASYLGWTHHRFKSPSFNGSSGCPDKAQIAYECIRYTICNTCQTYEISLVLMLCVLLYILGKRATVKVREQFMKYNRAIIVALFLVSVIIQLPTFATMNVETYLRNGTTCYELMIHYHVNAVMYVVHILTSLAMFTIILIRIRQRLRNKPALTGFGTKSARLLVAPAHQIDDTQSRYSSVELKGNSTKRNIILTTLILCVLPSLVRNLFLLVCYVIEDHCPNFDIATEIIVCDILDEILFFITPLVIIEYYVLWQSAKKAENNERKLRNDQWMKQRLKMNDMHILESTVTSRDP